jgi:hypothetical protein
MQEDATASHPKTIFAKNRLENNATAKINCQG